MSESRNDHTHFPPVNGPGHRRRKVVNRSQIERLEQAGLDPYEQRALLVIGALDRYLRQVQLGQRPRFGDPGE